MEEWVERYLVALGAEKHCSPHTVTAYRNDLMQLAAHLTREGVVVWCVVVPEQVTGYLQSLRERQYASSTIARKTAAAKSFFHYLKQAGGIAADVSLHLFAPHVDRYVPHAISTDEVARLLAAPTRIKTPESLRDAAMLQLLYATGMRVSELVSLDLSDLDLAKGCICCEGRGARHRLISLTLTAHDALQRYLVTSRPIIARAHGADTEALFLNHRGQRLTRQGFWLILKGYAQSASVRNVTPHTLRHTFAAHALTTGHHLREVQTMLGHVSISTTQVYQRMRPVPAAQTAPGALPALSVVKMLGGGSAASPLSLATASGAAAMMPAGGEVTEAVAHED
ncbi:MAG: tyrosine-type recombinase/integrase [Chloroflexota bacterium]|nr:tyrosine-type recombinase/integrase [Chloroflexota bacterium]